VSELVSAHPTTQGDELDWSHVETSCKTGEQIGTWPGDVAPFYPRDVRLLDIASHTLRKLDLGESQLQAIASNSISEISFEVHEVRLWVSSAKTTSFKELANSARAGCAEIRSLSLSVLQEHDHAYPVKYVIPR
jgi:hypothetical protein